LYFSDPKHFNDPVDCQIGIADSLKSAVSLVEKEEPGIISKINKLGSLEHVFEKIENDVKKAAVLSLSKNENDMLMWSHYADSHRGFSLGFSFTSYFTKYNEKEKIIGMNEVQYFEDNPFSEYFLEFARCSKVPEWDEFWVSLFSLGLVAKSIAWRYENEIRIIRVNPGKIRFSHEELKVVTLGLNMKPSHRKHICKVLSKEEWSHVKVKKVIRESDGFKLRVIDENEI
jgi:hypothetical protein